MSAEELNGLLDEKLLALHRLVAAAQSERERLEAAVAEARRHRLPVPADTLALLDSLGGAPALPGEDVLAAVAARLPPTAAPIDLFQHDQPLLEISSLVAQGHSAAEISRRLGRPLGEVELLMSARPTS